MARSAAPVSSAHAHDPALAAWLPTGAEVYHRMFALIAAARASIRFETYIWTADDVGGRFRTVLTEAARRGVQVRVLVDGAGTTDLPAAYWHELTTAGGKVHVFNPLTFRYFSLRDHRKLLLVDDAVAITGGCNIADEYEGDGVTRGWRDLGLELRHPAAMKPLAASFDSMFAGHRVRHWLKHQFRQPAFLRQSGPVLFSGPHLRRNQFHLQLLRSLRQARSVRIVSAYFVPGLRLRRALAAVARRGGKVEILVAGKTDVALAQRAARSLYGPLLRAGVRIWEYQPQILHAKLALVDDAFFVGSANLDARSFAINYELTVHLTDKPLVAEASAAFAKDLLQSREVTLAEWRQSRTWFTRLRGAWARFLMTRVDPWLARRQLRDIA